MVNQSLPESARLAIRSTVCLTCERRPVGSESWVPQQARPCEGGCPIFGSMHRLLGIASSYDLDAFGECEDAITDVVCPNCTVSKSPGDFCPSRSTCTCPLFCNSAKVLTVLEKIVRHKPRTKPIAPKPKPREVDQAR